MKEKAIGQCLKQFAAYLKVDPGKITKDEDGILIRTKGNTTAKGVFNILNEMLTESKSTLGGTTPLERAYVRQWIEYAIIYASADNTSSIFSTLNDTFLKKTYLVGNKLSAADIVLYYVLLDKVESLTYLEKEKYVNVCRWFDNIQQNPLIRQSNHLVEFNTIYLASIVPARH